MGSNMAENHPVGFQWVMEARERGAQVIHVDPRFTRTSAMASKWVGVRAGSDIAFLGGIINYILEHGRWFEEYVKTYTNAPVVIDEKYEDTEALDGFFSGWNPEEGRYGEYDITTWADKGTEPQTAPGSKASHTRGEQSAHGGGVMALRGHASIQGSTDLATLFNILPGYLSMPQSDVEGGLKKYIESATAPAGWWGKADTFIVSLLKAWWGPAATKQNDFCFD